MTIKIVIIHDIYLCLFVCYEKIMLVDINLELVNAYFKIIETIRVILTDLRGGESNFS